MASPVLRLGLAEQQHGVFDVLAGRLVVAAPGEQQTFGALMQRAGVAQHSYERADGRNAGIGGEHFSLVLGANGRVKGFARIDLDLVGGELPPREEVQEIAMAF